MKRLFSLLFIGMVGAAPLMAGQSGSAGTATDPSRNAEYLWVLNADAVAHEIGDVVVFYDGTYDGIEVATTTSANSKLVAGIVALQDMPANGYGFVQVYGYHSGATIGVANSAGDCLGTSTTAEALGITTTVGACVATALEATTSSTTVKVLIHGK